MVGTSFLYIEFLARPGQARALQIELDPDADRGETWVEVGVSSRIAAKHWKLDWLQEW
jgi:hypothetical protein